MTESFDPDTELELGRSRVFCQLPCYIQRVSQISQQTLSPKVDNSMNAAINMVDDPPMTKTQQIELRLSKCHGKEPAGIHRVQPATFYLLPHHRWLNNDNPDGCMHIQLKLKLCSLMTSVVLAAYLPNDGALHDNWAWHTKQLSNRTHSSTSHSGGISTGQRCCSNVPGRIGFCFDWRTPIWPKSFQPRWGQATVWRTLLPWSPWPHTFVKQDSKPGLPAFARSCTQAYWSH